MEDLSKRSHLLNRNGHYYLRVRVPVDLAEQYNPQVEIKRSLKTKDLKEAKHRLSLELLKVEEEFQKKRRQAAPQVISESRAVPLQNLISKIDLERAVLVWHKVETTKSALEDDQLRLGLSEDDRETILNNLKEDLAAYSSTDESVYIPAIQSTATKILSEAAIEKEALTTELRQYFYGLIRQALVEQIFESFERYGKSFRRAPSTLFYKTQSLSRLSESEKTNDISLQELLKRFFKAKSSDGVTEKSLAGYKLTYDFLLELFGRNKPIKSITPDDCRTFRDKIALVPSNAKKIYPHLTLLQAIEAGAKDNKDVLKVKSVNTHLKNLSAIFNFARRERLIEYSPAENIKKLEEFDAEDDGHSPFCANEIHRVFSTPLYTGCKDDERGYNKPGNQRPRRHRFWVPLISLYTGMRLNEICQLFTEDIESVDGIHVFQIKIDADKIKTLKTKQSRRTIPIHNSLIQIGFLDYVESIKALGSKTLFPYIPKSKRKSSSDCFSKWFGRFLIASKIKTPDLCFHSFRHTFRDECRTHNINKEITAQLGGWKFSDDVMDSYGKGYELKRLQEEINKIHKNLTLNL